MSMGQFNVPAAPPPDGREVEGGQTPTPAVATVPRPIPRPGPPAGQPIRRRRERPQLTPDRAEATDHWLDANTGFAFAHAGCLDLLTAHYGNRLRYVDDVLLEWGRRTPRVRGLPQGATAQERAKFRRDVVLRRAAVILLRNAETVLGVPFSLEDALVTEVEALRVEIANLPEREDPPQPGDHWSNRGECASVVAAEQQPGPAVLLTNDAKATRLANNHGLAARSVSGVLRELVRAGTAGLTAEQAWGLYQRMCEVTDEKVRDRPTRPDDFR
jgi:hypothetical protein